MYVKRVLETEGSTVATTDGKTVAQVFQEAGIKVINLTLKLNSF
jgi:hypothetical protein